MILSDLHINAYLASGQLKIEPEINGSIQPASYELHLAEKVKLSPNGDNHYSMWGITDFRLSHTIERVTIPDTLCAQVNGKSSLGRLGLLVHATAGFVDPGFQGQITLELKNIGHEVIMLDEGQAVAQLVFHQLTSAVLRGYGHPELGSHYQGQMGTTPSHLETETTAHVTP